MPYSSQLRFMEGELLERSSERELAEESLEEELEIGHVRCPSCGKVIQPLVRKMRDLLAQGVSFEVARRKLHLVRECCISRVIRPAQMPEEFLVDEYASRDTNVIEMPGTSLLLSQASGFEISTPTQPAYEMVSRAPMEPGTYRVYIAK